jgi:hypothetical protein
MSRSINEADWKVFRTLQPVALDRFCERILSEISAVASDGSKSNHERYLAVYRLVEHRDKEIADAFKDLRRSTAIQQIARIQLHELLTAEELSRFSAETRNAVELFLEMWHT